MKKAKPKAAGCTKQKAFITHLCLSQSIPPPIALKIITNPHTNSHIRSSNVTESCSPRAAKSYAERAARCYGETAASCYGKSEAHSSQDAMEKPQPSVMDSPSRRRAVAPARRAHSDQNWRSSVRNKITSDNKQKSRGCCAPYDDLICWCSLHVAPPPLPQ